MKCKQIIDSPIFSMESGEVVGTLYKLIIDKTDKKISYCLIKKPASDNVFILPFEKVINIGDRSVIIDSDDSLKDIESYEPYPDIIKEEFDVIEKAILDDADEIIGEILDYSIDKKTGQIVSFICHEFKNSKKVEIAQNFISALNNNNFSFDVAAWYGAVSSSTEYIDAVDPVEDIAEDSSVIVEDNILVLDENSNIEVPTGDNTDILIPSTEEDSIAIEPTSNNIDGLISTADEDSKTIEPVIDDVDDIISVPVEDLGVESAEDDMVSVSVEGYMEPEAVNDIVMPISDLELLGDKTVVETADLIIENDIEASLVSDSNESESEFSGDSMINRQNIITDDIERIKEELREEIRIEIRETENRRYTDLFSEKEKEIVDLKSYLLKSQDEPLKQITLQQEKRIKEFEKRIIEIRKEQETKFNLAMAEKESEINKIKETTAQLEQDRARLMDLEQEYKQKIEHIEGEQQAQVDKYEGMIDVLCREYDEKIDVLSREYDEKIDIISHKYEDEIAEIKNENDNFKKRQQLLEEDKRKLNELVLNKENEIKDLEQRLKDKTKEKQVINEEHIIKGESIVKEDLSETIVDVDKNKMKNSDRLKALHRMQQEKSEYISGFTNKNRASQTSELNVAPEPVITPIPEIVFDLDLVSAEYKETNEPELVSQFEVAQEPVIVTEPEIDLELEVVPESIIIPELVMPELVFPDSVINEPIVALEVIPESELDVTIEPEGIPELAIPELIFPEHTVAPESEVAVTEPVVEPESTVIPESEIIPEPEEDETEIEEIQEAPTVKKTANKASAKNKQPTEDDVVEKQKANLLGRKLTKSIMDKEGNVLVSSGKIINEAIFEEVRKKKKDSIIEMFLYSE